MRDTTRTATNAAAAATAVASRLKNRSRLAADTATSNNGPGSAGRRRARTLARCSKQQRIIIAGAKSAELAIKLRKLGMAKVSRRSNFVKPPEKALKEFLEQG
jgi:hypothetical protein